MDRVGRGTLKVCRYGNRTDKSSLSESTIRVLQVVDSKIEDPSIWRICRSTHPSQPESHRIYRRTTEPASGEATRRGRVYVPFRSGRLLDHRWRGRRERSRN